METVNTKLKDPKANRDFYTNYDNKYISLDDCYRSHMTIPRLGWGRHWMLKLGCKSMLDLGGQEGFFGIRMAKDGLRVHVLDPMKSAIEHGKKITEGENLNIEFSTGFFEDIEWKEEFDMVACMEVIEHVVDPDELMKGMCKVGKYLMITTPFAYGPFGLEDAKNNPGHIRLYTLKELKDLCSKYGDILEAKVEGGIVMLVMESK